VAWDSAAPIMNYRISSSSIYCTVKIKRLFGIVLTASPAIIYTIYIKRG
jgi:hypothetical protein